ncbi:hypothetical protein Nepgr_002681 [Nepenthes gracilis]|uniref:Uncharacterized protein n=1 Tax=Nepenthes gracilis TaxID=150966 RepID=A0AAD3RX39_NEPGR|nr:hypothetical protein Nepgr_002681 [Nepenthes gracilis]
MDREARLQPFDCSMWLDLVGCCTVQCVDEVSSCVSYVYRTRLRAQVEYGSVLASWDRGEFDNVVTDALVPAGAMVPVAAGIKCFTGSRCCCWNCGTVVSALALLLCGLRPSFRIGCSCGSAMRRWIGFLLHLAVEGAGMMRVSASLWF